MRCPCSLPPPPFDDGVQSLAVLLSAKHADCRGPHRFYSARVSPQIGPRKKERMATTVSATTAATSKQSVHLRPQARIKGT